MRFVVPQFIEVEDKIIGPLSVRQFIIFLVSFGIIFILYKLFSFFIFIIFGLMIFTLSGVFAFTRINGQAFHYFLLNIIYSLKRPRLKVWKKEILKGKGESHQKGKIKMVKIVPPKKMVTTSKLAQLSLVVDTGGAYKEEENEEIKITPSVK